MAFFCMKKFHWPIYTWLLCESRTGDSTRPPTERKCKEIFELIDLSANVSGNKGIAVTWGVPMQQIHGQGQAQKFLVEMLGNSLLGFLWALHTTMCFFKEFTNQIYCKRQIEYKTWASSSFQELTLAWNNNDVGRRQNINSIFVGILHCIKHKDFWKDAKHKLSSFL